MRPCNPMVIIKILKFFLGVLNFLACVFVIACNCVILDGIRAGWSSMNSTDQGNTFWAAVKNVYTIFFCFLLLSALIPTNWGPSLLRYIVLYLKFFRSFFARGMLLFYVGVLTRDSQMVTALQEKLGNTWKYSNDAISGLSYTVMAIGGAHVAFSLIHRCLKPRLAGEESMDRGASAPVGSKIPEEAHVDVSVEDH
eukprot:RCo018941